MARKSKAKDIHQVTNAGASVDPRTPKKRERNADSSTTPRSIRRPREEKEEVVRDTSENYHKPPSTATRRKRKRSPIESYGAENELSVVDLEGTEVQYKQETPTRISNVTIVEVVGQVSNIEDNPKKSRKGEKTRITIEERKEEVSAEDSPKKARRRKKTKEEKEAEAMPLAARTKGLKMFIGAHVSGAKGALYSTSHYQKLLFICIGLLTVEVPS